MDHPPKIKTQPGAGAPERPPSAAEPAAKKKPTTLLDAYEVECIRRELEKLILKQNQNAGASAAPDAHGHRRRDHHHHHHVISCKNTTAGAKKGNPSPAAAAKNGARGGVRVLGRHAVAICSGTGASVVVGGGRRRRRGGYREVEKV